MDLDLILCYARKSILLPHLCLLQNQLKIWCPKQPLSLSGATYRTSKSAVLLIPDRECLKLYHCLCIISIGSCSYTEPATCSSRWLYVFQPAACISFHTRSFFRISYWYIYTELNNNNTLKRNQQFEAASTVTINSCSWMSWRCVTRPPAIFIVLGGNERKLSCKNSFKCNFLIYLMVDSSPMNRFLCPVNGGVWLHALIDSNRMSTMTFTNARDFF